jgi:hypothetical protein
MSGANLELIFHLGLFLLGFYIFHDYLIRHISRMWQVGRNPEQNTLECGNISIPKAEHSLPILTNTETARYDLQTVNF